MLIEGMECPPYNRHGETDVLFASFHLPQDLHLNIKEFFELESFACPLHARRVLREMYSGNSFAKPHEMIALDDIHSERIHQSLTLKFWYELGYDGAHCLGIKPRTLHALGSIIVWFKPLCHLGLHLTHRRKFGMHKIVLLVKA